MIPVRPEWQQEAACRGMDPDLFFPVGRTGDAVGDIALAREVCAGCPVAADCLEFALSARNPVISAGIWAGLTDRQLERLRAERALAAS